MRMKAKNTIRHDGIEYAEGDVFEVKDAKQAERLFKLGAAVETGEKPSGGDVIEDITGSVASAPAPAAKA